MSAAADLNRQVGALQSLVIALADTRLLQTGDLAAFHAQASELVRRQDLTAVLYDSTGQELVNTSVTFGSELPVDPAATSNVAGSGQAYVSDLTTDARTGKSVVNIPVPVMRDGKLAYVAGLQISNAIAAVIAEQRTLQEQTVGLVDRRGVIIYRTREPERFVGRQVPPDFLANIEGRDEGSFLTTTRDGVPNYVAFSRVRRAGWVLAVAIPSRVLFQPVNQSLRRLLAFGAGTLLLACLIAWGIGRAIAKPVTRLARLATALGKGERTDQPPPTHIREVDAVAEAMLAATESLRQQTEQRARTMDAL